MSVLKPAAVGAKDLTRRKLLHHASKLMVDNGSPPTVAEVASAANISRPTAYRYFSTADELAAAATLEHLRQEIATLTDAALTLADPESRIDATVRAIVDLTFRHERVFRSMIRVSICEPKSSRVKARLKWYRTALQPLKERLGVAGFNRLVEAIVLAIGFESIIKLKDDCATSVADTANLAAWIARTLVRQAIAEAEPRRRLASRKHPRHE